MKSPSTPRRGSALDFLQGGGAVSALMRDHDWSTSPLGPLEGWPQSLRSVVGLLLQSRFPMFVAWGKDLAFLYNDPYAEILGAKHPRALGIRFQDIWSEIWTDISPLIDAAMAGHASYREDLPLTMNRKGFEEQTWFTFSYSPVRDESGRVAGMFCAVSETTGKVLAERALRELNETLERRVIEALEERLRDQERLRKAEEALLQSQKLESLGQLTGGIAHDFNNLLAVISGGVQVLERIKDPAQHERVLQGMRRAVERGTGLTRHLLAFSRRRPVNAESIDLSVNVSGMRELLVRSLRGDINIVMEFEPGLWPVEVDAGEAELAIINLGVNARDAMPNGGTITITAENVTDAGGDFVCLRFSDTGTGMPPEVLARVFEPFFTTKELGKGSGLGLPQVYGFAKQSRGTVTIDSEVGRGTTVTVMLPRALTTPVVAAPLAAINVVPTRGDQREGSSVMLVEDDAEVAALTSEMLRSLGYKVRHMPSAAAALAFMTQDSRIDIVLSDIMMPGGMSGLELAREFRRRRPGLPIVLMTGYAEAAASLQQENFGLLLKPYPIDALADALAQGLQKTNVSGAA